MTNLEHGGLPNGMPIIVALSEFFNYLRGGVDSPTNQQIDAIARTQPSSREVRMVEQPFSHVSEGDSGLTINLAPTGLPVVEQQDTTTTGELTPEQQVRSAYEKSFNLEKFKSKYPNAVWNELLLGYVIENEGVTKVFRPDVIRHPENLEEGWVFVNDTVSISENGQTMRINLESVGNSEDFFVHSDDITEEERAQNYIGIEEAILSIFPDIGPKLMGKNINIVFVDSYDPSMERDKYLISYQQWDGETVLAYKLERPIGNTITLKVFAKPNAPELGSGENPVLSNQAFKTTAMLFSIVMVASERYGSQPVSTIDSELKKHPNLFWTFIKNPYIPSTSPLAGKPGSVTLYSEQTKVFKTGR